MQRRISILWRRIKLTTAYKFIAYIIDRICETRVSDAAGAIAYYAIVSFFPLTLLLIAFNSAFLQSNEVQMNIINKAEDLMPGLQQLVMPNLQQLIKASETVGFVSTVVLLYSATLFFASFAQNINIAWEEAESRHFLKDRFIGLVIIAGMVMFIIFILLITTFFETVPQFFPDWAASLGELIVRLNSFQQMFLQYLPTFSIFMMLLLLYKYIPNCQVYWREAFLACSFSGLSIQLTKWIFVWYVTEWPDRYSIIYGSLGTIVVFMLWIYLFSYIILLGGHISAATAHFFRSKRERFAELPPFPAEI